MASEPYWALAPSRRISMRSMAASGMAFRSVPVLPRPRDPKMLMSDDWWRRLPLMSTSVWSGPRPPDAGGIHVVGAVGAGLPVGVEGRGGVVEQLVHVELAGGPGRLRDVDHVDRDRRFHDGAVGAPGAHDFDSLEGECRQLHADVEGGRTGGGHVLAAISHRAEDDDGVGRAHA